MLKMILLLARALFPFFRAPRSRALERVDRFDFDADMPRRNLGREMGQLRPAFGAGQHLGHVDPPLSGT